MESTSIAQPAGPVEVGDKGLKKDAIGFTGGLVIALASTAPAYSLAAVIGTVVVLVGANAPGVLLLSFVPMFLIAGAFYYMNRADQDCGTTFSWVTRALGPGLGWLAGWAVCVTGILVVGSLADVASYYLFDLVGFEGARDSRFVVTVVALGFIALMTLVCVLGTELSARLQKILTGYQVAALLLFAVVAIAKVAAGTAPDTSADPELSWFSPFAVDDFGALISALLIGVFIYWGWESAVNLNEETENSVTAPGLAAVTSTVILLVAYVGVAVAIVAFAGIDALSEFDDDPAVLGTIARDVLGSPLDKLVALAVVISALASTQTTILPASRTSLSMARADAMPRRLGDVHPRFHTPHVSTVLIGVLATVWYLPLKLTTENFLSDSLTALAFMIAFYYALSGLACAVYYRHELTRSAKTFLLAGVGPVVGALMLGYLFVRAVIEYADPADSYTGSSWFGVAPPVVTGLGFIVLGIVLMLIWRAGGHERFFGRAGFEAVPPEIARGEASGAESLAGPPPR